MNLKKLAMTAAMLGGAVFAGQAAAQIAEYGSGDQGSVVIWPYDTSNNEETKIRLVNSGTQTQSVHFVRVCHGIKDGDDKCDKLDRSFTLTPNQTLTLDVETNFNTNFTPNCDFGHIVAYAEQTANSRIPVSYNHLYGDVRMNRTANGRRMGMAPAIAIRSLLAENAVAGAAGQLAFDGANFEQVHSNQKSTIRAGASATRNTRFYLFTFDLLAGAQNEPTLISVDSFNEAEDQTSSTLEYVCSVRVDTNDVNQLNGTMLQSFMGSANGSVKLFNAQNANTGLPVGIGGWTVREEGNGRRAMKPIWNDDAPVSTIFSEL